MFRVVSVTAFSFTHPPVLSAQLLINPLSLQIPRADFPLFGSRAFSVFGPFTRNVLPLPLRKKPSPDSFKSNLKTFFFFSKQWGKGLTKCRYHIG